MYFSTVSTISKFSEIRHVCKLVQYLTFNMTRVLQLPTLTHYLKEFEVFSVRLIYPVSLRFDSNSTKLSPKVHYNVNIYSSMKTKYLETCEEIKRIIKRLIYTL